MYRERTEEEWKSLIRREEARQERHAKRKVEHPTQARLIELFWASAFILAATSGFIGLVVALGSRAQAIIAKQSQQVFIAELAACALVVGIIAWFAREKVEFKLYPIAEIVLGMALATSGAIADKPDTVAALIAFVGGVRIVIDGITRFFKYRSYELFSSNSWRRIKNFVMSTQEAKPYAEN
jgi:hypothetical protein